MGSRDLAFPFGQCFVTGGLYEASKLGDGDLVSCQKEVINLDVMNGFSRGHGLSPQRSPIWNGACLPW